MNVIGINDFFIKNVHPKRTKVEPISNWEQFKIKLDSLISREFPLKIETDKDNAGCCSDSKPIQQVQQKLSEKGRLRQQMRTPETKSKLEKANKKREEMILEIKNLSTHSGLS